MSTKTWPHFSLREIASPDTGEHEMQDSFMARLEALRVDYGKPMHITSGYRTPQHNATVSQTGTTGPHTTGRAVDIRISGEEAYVLIAMALSRGFTGIGINQKGIHAGRFIHLDDLPDGSHPRPRVWSY